MKLYILKLYGSECKFSDDCDIAGYYTSKAALVRELKKHAEELGEVYSSCHDVNTIEEHAKFDFRYMNAELANIEIEYLNEWSA